MTEPTITLFDLGPISRAVTGTGLVWLDTSSCPSCGSPTRVIYTRQLPLLRAGGNGLTKITEADCCRNIDCGWYLERRVYETHRTARVDHK
jgi:hypothetical protein